MASRLVRYVTGSDPLQVVKLILHFIGISKEAACSAEAHGEPASSEAQNSARVRLMNRVQ